MDFHSGNNSGKRQRPVDQSNKSAGADLTGEINSRTFSRVNTQDMVTGLTGVVCDMAIGAVVGVLCYPLELFKTRALLSTERQSMAQCLKQKHFPGLLPSLARPILVGCLANLMTETQKETYFQGMEFIGFWRRAITEGTSIFLAATYSTLPDLFKQRAMIQGVKMCNSVNPEWYHGILLRNWFWGLSMINSATLMLFYLAEKGLSEQIRKFAYKKNEKLNYLGYDRTSLTEKIITVSIASIVTYPLEVCRVVYTQILLEKLEKGDLTFRQIAQRMRAHFAAIPWTYLRSSFVPYFCANYIFILGFLKFNESIRALS